MNDFSFSIPPNHPCLAGHFPGRPVVPATVVLEAVTSGICGRRGTRRVTHIHRCKFIRPLWPGQTCKVTFAAAGPHQVRFTCRNAGQLLASGTVTLEPTGHG